MITSHLLRQYFLPCTLYPSLSGSLYDHIPSIWDKTIFFAWYSLSGSLKLVQVWMCAYCTWTPPATCHVPHATCHMPHTHASCPGSNWVIPDTWYAEACKPTTHTQDTFFVRDCAWKKRMKKLKTKKMSCPWWKIKDLHHIRVVPGRIETSTMVTRLSILFLYGYLHK